MLVPSVKSVLSRFASSLPVENQDRRTIFAKLRTVVASNGIPRPFVHADYYGWADVAEWPGGAQPWIVELPFSGDIEDRLKLGEHPPGYEESTGQNTQSVTAIAHSEGALISFSSDDGKQGPMFINEFKLRSIDAEEVLRDVAMKLRLGVLPRGFRHID